MAKKNDIPDVELVDLSYDNYFGQPWEDPMDGTVGEVFCSFGYSAEEGGCGTPWAMHEINECDLHCPAGLTKYDNDAHEYIRKRLNKYKLIIKKWLIKEGIISEERLNHYESHLKDEREYWDKIEEEMRERKEGSR